MFSEKDAKLHIIRHLDGKYDPLWFSCFQSKVFTGSECDSSCFIPHSVDVLTIFAFLKGTSLRHLIFGLSSGN